MMGRRKVIIAALVVMIIMAATSITAFAWDPSWTAHPDAYYEEEINTQYGTNPSNCKDLLMPNTCNYYDGNFEGRPVLISISGVNNVLYVLQPESENAYHTWILRRYEDDFSNWCFAYEPGTDNCVYRIRTTEGGKLEFWNEGYAACVASFDLTWMQ